jgi:hypothetical protein
MDGVAISLASPSAFCAGTPSTEIRIAEPIRNLFIKVKLLLVPFGRFHLLSK